MTCPVLSCRFEVLMQANTMSSEYDEISDMHKKVVRVSFLTQTFSVSVTLVPGNPDQDADVTETGHVI